MALVRWFFLILGSEERGWRIWKRQQNATTFALRKIPLINGSGVIPALGFGTLIPDPVDTIKATIAALEAGFRQLDSAERYGLSPLH
jgi:hypothetical protein